MDKTEQHKKAMLDALESSLGVVTSACKSVGIGRTTHYMWMENDPEYKKAVDDLQNVALDYAESKLHSQIKRRTLRLLSSTSKQRQEARLHRTPRDLPRGYPDIHH